MRITRQLGSLFLESFFLSQLEYGQVVSKMGKVRQQCVASTAVPASISVVEQYYSWHRSVVALHEFLENFVCPMYELPHYFAILLQNVLFRIICEDLNSLHFCPNMFDLSQTFLHFFYICSKTRDHIRGES